LKARNLSSSPKVAKTPLLHRLAPLLHRLTLLLHRLTPLLHRLAPLLHRPASLLHRPAIINVLFSTLGNNSKRLVCIR
ncbi:MAG: hypothetical protein RMX97_28920, partial [Nostoc sp. DedQUE11]|nr:hypothetical protein [Nostoc sp. DedQUE11]